jgi:KUP system potassium uptake protein
MPESIAAPAGSDEAAKVQQASQSRAGLVGLAIGSIGVVYGDIGTSPLYALREAVNAAAGPDAPATPDAVFGMLSPSSSCAPTTMARAVR